VAVNSSTYLRKGKREEKSAGAAWLKLCGSQDVSVDAQFGMGGAVLVRLPVNSIAEAADQAVSKLKKRRIVVFVF
jgi:hypothetical protein